MISGGLSRRPIPYRQLDDFDELYPFGEHLSVYELVHHPWQVRLHSGPTNQDGFLETVIGVPTAEP